MNLTVAALAVVATAVASATAEAKPCGTVMVNRAAYVVGGDGVSCSYMRTWTKRMARDGRRPRGWDRCTIKPDGGGCERGPANDRDFFIYCPPH